MHAWQVELLLHAVMYSISCVDFNPFYYGELIICLLWQGLRPVNSQCESTTSRTDKTLCLPITVHILNGAVAKEIINAWKIGGVEPIYFSF